MLAYVADSQDLGGKRESQKTKCLQMSNNRKEFIF